MNKLKVLLGREKSLLYGEEVDDNIEEGSELESEALEQTGGIDDLTYEYINELVGTSETDYFPWNDEIIAKIRDSTLTILRSKGYRIWYPHINNVK